jgi:hypothetical protein
MPIFKLYIDSLYQTWYRDYYTVEAETEEEAVQLIKDYEVEPDDSEQLFEFEQEPIRKEIYNDEDKLIYSDGSRQL